MSTTYSKINLKISPLQKINLESVHLESVSLIFDFLQS